MQLQGREPDLTTDDLAWLSSGGPFPERVTIERQDGSHFTFELEDRDCEGRIYGGHERRGKKGFVLFGRDVDSEESVALKFCVETDYLGPRSPQEETRLAALLRPLATTVAAPRQTGKVPPFDSQPDTSCGWVCFVSERIYGSTLKEWAKKNPNSITPDRICEIAVTLVKVVLFLEAKQLKHDDLHWGNLMLRDIDPAVRLGRPSLPESELCVIDTGSLKHIEQPTSKPHDDWSQVANVLANLHAVVFKNRQLAARSAGMLRQLEVFCADILEGDRSRSFPTQESFYTAIERMRTELRTGEASKVHDFDPFGVISAEHLADDTLLLDLFVKTLPWMNEVSRPSPMVIEGPRGCGKSMLFRYLSARTHISTPDAASQMKDLPFFGIYLSCSSDLQSELFWLSSRDDLVAERRDSIVTLFNLLLVREFFRTIDKLLYRNEIATNADVSEADVSTLITYCREQLPTTPTMPRLRVASIAGDFADELDVLRRVASNAVATGITLETPLPYYFLRDFAAIATQTIGFLKGRQIVFLLDDYTSHRVPAAVQRLLNPIVFARQPTYVFKVSCEYFGIDTTTDAGLRIDQNREYESVDTGAWVVERLNSRKKREFIEALIDRRLERAGYAGRSRNLIGRSPFKKDSELAQRIKSLKTGKHNYYSGLDVLGNLWSGDIATIIHFIRTMFQRGAVKRDQVKQIEATAQHEAIREVSRGLVLTVQGYDPHGKAMHQILEQLGGLASDLLRSSKEDSKKVAADGSDSAEAVAGQSIPQRKYRIEMTKFESYDVFAELSRRSSDTIDLGSLAQEMIRRSVFLELRPSTGKEGRDKETVRWQLRAALLPAYGLSLVRRSYLNVLSIDDLITLLADPKTFRDANFTRYSTDKAVRKPPRPPELKSTRDMFEPKEPQ